MINSIRKNFILVLYLLMPFGYLFGYVLELIGSVNIGLNFIRVAILLLLFANNEKNKYWLALFIISYLLFNTFLFGGPLNTRFREITGFTMYLATLFSSKYILNSVQKIDTKLMNSFFTWVAYIFTLAFVITAAIKGPTVNDLGYDKRSYYNGFVISHQFSYFAILFAMIFFKYKKWPQGIVLCIMAVSVGNRTSFLILAAALVMFAEGLQIAYIKKMIKIGSIALFAIVSTVLLYSIYISEYLSYNKLMYILADPEHIKSTSGRSMFWHNGLLEIVKRPFLDFDWIFGQGPASVEVLSLRLYNVPFWMHNDYMQMLFCYGIFGIILFVLGITYFSKVNKTYSAVWFVIVAGVVNGFYTYGALPLLMMMVVILNFNPKQTRKVFIFATDKKEDPELNIKDQNNG
ncbi:O-antigen ligase family protein [Mucilaginibacter glaciei]|uniref:O-antigen ligase family protein n=1 Tax=Mucilaginibacter glaciei TaxID=2772109 RepID=A0A926NJP9_9SPHI|nr:O-antigen ligase family protein [Mucilaginibacter glaciei]MBD1393329.1 O-antigen ligase family protein [Mucilaginibacter glaciei]